MKKKWVCLCCFPNSTKKIILKMKLLTLFLLVTVATVTANNSYSQQTKFSMKLENVTVGQVFDKIERTSEFIFIYSEKSVDVTRKVNVDVEDENVTSILDQLFKGTRNRYEIHDRQIMVLSNEKVDKDVRNSIAGSQQKKNLIKGIITDLKGPLPGATVTILGTTRGVLTDVDGSYTVEANPGNKLVFTFIGMEPATVEVGTQTVINIQMKAKVAELDEVTVVAFGKQKKESVIGSITTIRPSELKVPSSNLTTALAGRVAGLISYQRSGEPGQDNADFFVRGVTTFGYKKDPLILIDGIELSSTDLARLQVDDIGSFNIMKDAAATALYGARGANGVILVTTKTGVEGKAKLSFRVENSFSAPTRDVELTDPVTFMTLANEAVLTRDPLQITHYSDEKIANTIANVNPIFFPANNWKNMLLKDYANNQRYNLNVSGGGAIARYYVAGSYSKDNGILKVDKRNNFNNNINLQKYTLRTNVNINVTPITELVVRLSGSFDDYTGPLDGGSGMYSKVMHSNPVLFPAYYPSEVSPFTSHIMFGNYDNAQYVNPYADMVKGYRDYSRSQMTAQFEVNQKLDFITKGLKFRTMMNTLRNSYFSVSRAYNPYYYSLDGYDLTTGNYQIGLLNENGGSSWLGYSEQPKEIAADFYLESALDYANSFGKHTVSGLLINIMKQNLQANAGSLQLSLPSRNLGLSGRMTYAYDSRYFFEFNFGYNGSERFYKKKRFGFFPSVGFAWNISKEAFWEPYKDVVTNFRLRGTYGLAGNDAIGSAEDRFFYLSNVDLDDSDKRAVFGRNLGYSRNGVTVSRYANENITWEIAEKANVAIELGLWGKLDLIAEIFNEYRHNILMSRADVPVTMGLASSIRANVGEASGKGTDISLDFNQIWNKDLWLTLRGNFTYATSKYKVYEEPQYAEKWRFHVGNSLSQQYGYIAERLFIDDEEVSNSPRQNFGEYAAGDIKYTDVNRDGQITQADMVPIGNPTTPEIVYGFGFSLGMKKFDFSAFFQGLANESFWINPSTTAPFQNETQILKAYADSYWSEDNRNVYALWPRLSSYAINNNTQTSTWFMRDGSFLRLKQIEIGYTLPRSIQDKLRTSTCRFYVSGTNLLTFSKFKLWDVEMGGNGLGYPNQRTLNIGVNISFN